MARAETRRVRLDKAEQFAAAAELIDTFADDDRTSASAPAARSRCFFAWPRLQH